MKIWTVQNEQAILDGFNKEGCYLPDFSKSEYLRTKPENTQIYYTLLADFNNLNKVYARGLIFGFVSRDDNKIQEIPSFEEFKKFVNAKKPAIYSLWNNYVKNADKYKILELDYGASNETDFEPIFMDINDFQYMMEPIVLFNWENVQRILEEMATGHPLPCFCPSGAIQVVAPIIEPQHITNVYDMFDFDNKEYIALPDDDPLPF